MGKEGSPGNKYHMYTKRHGRLMEHMVLEALGCMEHGVCGKTVADEA